MATWFYMDLEKEIGPVGSEDLKRLAAAGVVDADSLVRRSDSSQWIKANKIQGLILPGVDYARELPPTPQEAMPAAPSPKRSVIKENDALIAGVILAVLEVIWFFCFARFWPHLLIHAMIGSIYFGLCCSALGAVLKKNPWISLSIGMGFGILGLLIVPFMPSEEGAR